MKFIKSTFGYFLATIVINSFWGIFTNKYGLIGGYISALILTGSMWYINHYLCLIKHDKDSAFIDMGLGIAISLVVKGYLVSGMNSVISSMPTLGCIAVGAILGGYTAVVIEKNIIEKNELTKVSQKEILVKKTYNFVENQR